MVVITQEAVCGKNRSVQNIKKKTPCLFFFSLNPMQPYHPRVTILQIINLSNFSTIGVRQDESNS